MNITVDVPDGVSGDWAVETFEVGGESMEIFNIRCLWNNQAHRRVRAGTYKRLVYSGPEARLGNEVVMSNTPAEINDHVTFIQLARRCETILINGLGLGVALKAILEAPTPKKVIVVEKEVDVISLVGPSFKDLRLQIVHADAFEYKPPKGMRFDAVWHDIWPTICEDNLEEMTYLHRKYGHKTEWQDSWAKAECRWA